LAYKRSLLFGPKRDQPITKGSIIEGTRPRIGHPKPKANPTARTIAGRFVEKLIASIEAELYVGSNLFIAPPKVSAHHVKPVVYAAPPVGTIKPGVKITLGKRESGNRKSIPSLLHSEEHRYFAIATYSLLNYGVKEPQIKQP
jgi:hypothetical protein